MPRILAVALALVLTLPGPLWAARQCTKTSTANYIDVGVESLYNGLNGASAMSIHAIVRADSLDVGGSDNRVYESFVHTGAGVYLSVSSSPATVRVSGIPVSGDTGGVGAAVGVTTINTGTVYSIGGVIDVPNDTIRVYVNGVQDGIATGLGWTSGVFTNTGVPTVPDKICGSTTTVRLWNGAVAEVAIWTVDIGTSGFEQLAQRIPASRIQPNALLYYWPLLGVYSPEIEVFNSKHGTLVGTPYAATAHPRMYRLGHPFFFEDLDPAPGGPTTRPGRLLLGVGQ